MKKFTIPVVLLSLLINSCSKTDDIAELKTEFDVNYITELNNTIYPSVIFGLTELEKQQNITIDYFTISINLNVNTDIKIVVEETKLNFETIITKNDVINDIEIIPSIKWKYDELKNLTQPGNIDLTFVCYNTSDNKEIARKDLKISYRSINECVLAAKIDNALVPLYPLIAGYVNEDSPVIDIFLQQVLLENSWLDSFVGYQAGDSVVNAQVSAVFYTLRTKGVKYSSITSTSNTNPNIFSQYIRFSDEVLNNTQANCADGTTFFCSVLKKIGIHTLMVFVPGHVYLGYYTNNEKTNLRLLETTLVGNLQYSFDDATEYQINSFNSNLSKFNNSDFYDGYFVIDIDEARSLIKPIGR